MITILLNRHKHIAVQNTVGQVLSPRVGGVRAGFENYRNIISLYHVITKRDFYDFIHTFLTKNRTILSLIRI